MTNYSCKLLLILFSIICQNAYSQDEFFHEIAIEKKLIENEKWEFVGEVNAKYIYDEIGWRRWGVSFVGVRKIKRFRFSGGTNGYYTFDKSITNFFEIRPWTDIQFNFPIVSKIYLRQKLKYEWRFFFTEGNNSTRENYRRLRYQIGFDIPLPLKEEASWKIRPYFEWFFIRDPATFERFSNERDFGILFIKRFSNEHELLFGYKTEVFYNTENEHGNGHIVSVGYSF
jgi:hypothetical protein